MCWCSTDVFPQLLAFEESWMCAHECVPMDVVNAVEEAHELGTQHHISCEISVALLRLMEHACVCPTSCMSTAINRATRPAMVDAGQQWFRRRPTPPWELCPSKAPLYTQTLSSCVCCLAHVPSLVPECVLFVCHTSWSSLRCRGHRCWAMWTAAFAQAALGCNGCEGELVQDCIPIVCTRPDRGSKKRIRETDLLHTNQHR